VLEREVAGIDDSCAETPEHERVVRVRTMPQSDEQGSEGNNVAVPVCRVPSARTLDQAAREGQEPETAGSHRSERVRLHARPAGVAACRRHRSLLRVTVRERQSLGRDPFQHGLILLA